MIATTRDTDSHTIAYWHFASNWKKAGFRTLLILQHFHRGTHLRCVTGFQNSWTSSRLSGLILRKGGSRDFVSSIHATPCESLQTCTKHARPAGLSSRASSDLCEPCPIVWRGVLFVFPFRIFPTENDQVLFIAFLRLESRWSSLVHPRRLTEHQLLPVEFVDPSVLEVNLASSGELRQPLRAPRSIDRPSRTTD